MKVVNCEEASNRCASITDLCISHLFGSVILTLAGSNIYNEKIQELPEEKNRVNRSILKMDKAKEVK